MNATEQKGADASALRTMSDEDFEAHVATIERYASRSAPVSEMIPSGVMPYRSPSAREAKLEKYQEQIAERAVAICTAGYEQGQTVDYDTAYAQAEKEVVGTS